MNTAVARPTAPGVLRIAAAVLVPLLLPSAVTAAEQAYPSRPVRVVAPFPPGSGVDIIARVVAQTLTEAWKQSFIVENRPGAGGTIGSEVVAKSNPDGYTLLLGNVSTLAIAPSLYRKLPYDPVRDFAPITLITTMNSVVVVHPSVPARSLRELVSLAKAKPRSLSYGSAGSGTTGHLGAELFKSMTGIEMVHIPYKGSVPALTDLLAGQTQVMFATTATVLQHVNAGRLRPLGVTSLKRSDLLPGVPSINEAMLPGFEVGVWQAIVAPARTPEAIIARLHAEIAKSLRTPAMKEHLASQGLEAVGNSPREFGDYLRAEQGKWAKVVRTSGATVD
jgi:tripartite-type tricarboxylate transporter receptor subunit TctC